MSRQKFVALAAALALMLPIGAWANNYAVKVTPNQWQLIGVAGIFSLAGTGTAGQTPDLSSPYSDRNGIAVIDVADSWNNISWDANTTASDGAFPNAVGATALANPHFANGDTAVAANLAEANSGLGLPYHAVLGVRAIDLGSSSSSLLAKAIVVTGFPDSGKDYQSPLRTMYLTSPLSSGEPDMMIVYQATLEGDMFKVSFKDSNGSAWDFTSSGTDEVYTATFDHSRTYDNPLTAAELNLLTTTSGTAGATTQYGQVVGTAASFDMNISAHLQYGYTSTTAYEGNRSVLDGNLTMYRYVGSAGAWETMTFEGDGSTESSTYGNNALTSGFGYWVRLNDNDNAGTYGTDFEPGFLARDSVRGQSSFYSGKLSEGWNLLAFDDSTLRYVTSGFVLADATAGDIDVISPYGDINITMTAPAGAGTGDECHAFNVAVTAYNTTAAMTGTVNTMDVRCFSVADNSAHVLISDKPFFVVLNTVADVANVTSLTGATFAATDMIDSDGGGVEDTLRTRMGEYAVVAERNEDYNTLTTDLGNLAVGVPSWKNVTPLELPAGGTVAAMTAAFNTYMTGTSVGGSNARILEVDLNTTTSNGYQTADVGRAILLAADERFYVRDATYIRTFDIGDDNGSILNLTYSGSNHATAAINHSYTGGAIRNCGTIHTAVQTATANTVFAYCPNVDSNTSLMVVTEDYLNFDVKESNLTVQLLTDVHAGSQTDTNNSFYGPFVKVYQPSKLTQATATADVTTIGSANVENLTYTAVWAEDFPNNGPLYYLAGQGYKPEMFITAVTSDGSTLSTAGTVSWKALDVTRDPVEWFDAASEFEVFWAEKERGYWVYLDTGYTNPVTASNTRVSSSVVNKHFENAINAATKEGTVFNWFDGYLTADVGGLVRPNYTSGQSYNVATTIGTATLPMATTGAVFAGGSSAFTTYLSDYEVSSLRPTGLIEANVSASDGLGGRDTDGVIITYVKPSTPALSFGANSITATSNTYAQNILIFDGNVSDLDHAPVHTEAATDGAATIDMTTVSGVAFPDALDVNGTGYVPPYATALGSIVKDLRFVASTGAADTVSSGIASGASVYSNMRQQAYVPAYSGTGHLVVGPTLSETNATIPYLYNVGGVTGDATRDYGVQLGAEAGVVGYYATLVYEPKDSELTEGGFIHANLFVDGVFVAQLGYMRSDYQGEPFFLYVIQNAEGATGKWYYGVFPGNNATETWGTSGTVSGTNYRLDLVEVSGLVQPL